MALWSKFLYTGKVLKLETLNDILTNKQQDCAYGLDLQQIGNSKIYGHNGMTLGVATDLRFIEEHKIIVAILSNVTADWVEPIRAFENGISRKFGNLEKRDIITESCVCSLDDSLAIFAAQHIIESICYAGIKDNQFLFFKGSKYGNSNTPVLPENVMQKIINFSIPKVNSY